MNRNLNFFLFLCTLIGVGVLVGYLVFATSKDDITFPVAELGNCADETECRAYCEDPGRILECVAFAERHNLISPEEAARARQFAAIGTGPGGCKNENECETYCNDISHIDECLAFGERHGFISPEELEEAKKVAQALKEGAQLPGGCKNKTECEAYCEDLSHMNECIGFAERAGFLSLEELKEARQVAQALQAGAQLPGGCRNLSECEAYCFNSDHIEECFAFAQQAGFIPPEELEIARKAVSLMARGETPGGCKSKEECEAYCTAGTHTEECVVFFEKIGALTQEELDMFRKTGGRGPGGCQGREECEAFCNNPANQEVCFNFAKEHGLIPEEDLQRITEGTEQLKTGLQSAPDEVKICLQSTVGTEILEEILAGTLLPGPQLGDQVRQCFEQFEQFMPRPEEFGPQPGDESGTPPTQRLEEFIPEQKTCIERILGTTPQAPPTLEQVQQIRTECFQAPPTGTSPSSPTTPEGFTPPPQKLQTPQFQGPGGCTNQEECQRYCSDPAHFQECATFFSPRSPGESGLGGALINAFLLFLQLLTL